MLRALTLGLFVGIASTAFGDMVITEWMYNGAGAGSTGEFVEFTNTGSAPVDMTGWSFDDDSRVPGTITLSGFGVVLPGQSVILTDETAATFAAIWGLSGVTIIGGNTANLGRNDEINLYDAGNNLVDRLTYGDESYPGTPRTQTKSCNIPAADYGYSVPQTSWVLAADGDTYGSMVSTRGEVGSPGRIVGYAWSDFDRDGDVDLADFGSFVHCFVGPFLSYDPPPSGCTQTPNGSGLIAADEDEDGDVDLIDFAAFQLCYHGEGVTVNTSCEVGSQGPVVTEIILNGSSITVIGSGVIVDGAKATINTAGSYTITGTLTDGQIVVNTPDPDPVQITLNGASITSSTNAPLYVISASQTVILLADGTTNSLTDPGTYTPVADDPNAALFSADPLVISGTGSLTVHGNFNDGIASKDTLLITGGTITVTAVDDGIRGKDELEIQGGTITVTSAGDGLKADNTDGPGLGVVTISGGTLDITSGGDGIAAETDMVISGGNLTIVSGGGSTVPPSEELSTKGVKGLASVAVSGGTFNINSSDDAVHSNGDVTISSPASLTLATGDDAVHADALLHVVSGSITITECFEGLDGANITIDNGTFGITCDNDAITATSALSIANGNYTILSGGGHTITIPSSSSAKALKGLTSVTITGGTFNIDAADDGVHSNGTITISGGTLTMAINNNTNESTGSYGDGIHADSSITISGASTSITVTTAYEGIESQYLTINGGTIRVTTTDDGLNAAGGSGTNNWIHINGGWIAVNAAGDGIDANGSIVMTGGTVIVHGPTVDNNAPIDYDTTFNISGGLLVAAGSAQMAQAPSSTSTQRSVKITYAQTKTAGTLAHIRTTSGGTYIVTFAPAKAYRSLVVSSPAFTAGLSCGLYRGGTCSGTVTDGLYSGGTYSGGAGPTTFTTTNIVTTVNNAP